MLLCLIIIAVTTAEVSFAQYSVQVTRDINYAGNLNREQTMTICKPINAPQPMPAFVAIHGGGFYSGDKSDPFMMKVCNRLAEKGYFVANINYRLVKNYDEFASIPNPNLRDTFAGALLDSQLAVRYLRSRAITLGIKSNKICSIGFSAGGHLAMFLGVLDANYPGDVANQLSRYSPKVNCVSSHYGASDLTVAITGPMNENNYAPIKSFINVEPIPQNIEAYAVASPLHYPLANAAPMHFVHGNADTTVLPFQSENMFDALKLVGVRTKLVQYNGGHGYQGLTQSQIWWLIDESVAWLQ